LVDAPARPVPVRALALLLAGAVVLAVGVQGVRGDEARRPAAPPQAAASASLAEPPPEVHTAVPVADAVLTAGGKRYRVGQEGDEVLVEDWDCDGEATPALLRPETGEVFVFTRWVDEGSLAVEPARRIAGATALIGELRDGACPTLAVRTSEGARVPIVEAGL
jgi:hypothetical protein